jgi:hypothetical protein
MDTIPPSDVIATPSTPSNEAGVTRFDPLLADVDIIDVRRAIAAFGPLRTYVEAPLPDGPGKGLTRRHDAVLNHYRRQQASGRVERMDVMAARTNLLRGTFGEPHRPLVPGVEALWNHPGFIAAAARVTGKPVVRPSMLYANALLPGQELAVHSDTPAYVGRDQTNTPEWLLVVMLRSGLFESQRIRIGAAVAFLSSPPAGGAFMVWEHGPDAPPTAVPARANTGVALDTDALFHGVAMVGDASTPAPPVRVGSELAWDEAAGCWRLSHPSRPGEDIARYGWDEVRLSFQWKGMCHPAETDPAQAVEPTDTDTILARLVDDMRAHGALGDVLPTGPQLAIAMIDHYVRFPTT